AHESRPTRVAGLERRMSGDDIKPIVRRQFERLFVAHERLCALADSLSERNWEKVGIDDERPSTQVICALYTKAWKTAQAVYILASEGYGEDATILASRLTHLAIDL